MSYPCGIISCVCFYVCCWWCFRGFDLIILVAVVVCNATVFARLDFAIPPWSVHFYCSYWVYTDLLVHREVGSCLCWPCCLLPLNNKQVRDQVQSSAGEVVIRRTAYTSLAPHPNVLHTTGRTVGVPPILRSFLLCTGWDSQCGEW